MRTHTLSRWILGAFLLFAAPAGAAVLTFSGALTSSFTVTQQTILHGYYVGDTYYPDEIIDWSDSGTTGFTLESLHFPVDDWELTELSNATATSDAFGEYLTWTFSLQDLSGIPLPYLSDYSYWDSVSASGSRTHSSFYSGEEADTFQINISTATRYDYFGSGFAHTAHEFGSFTGGGTADTLGGNFFSFNATLLFNVESVGMLEDRQVTNSYVREEVFHFDGVLRDWPLEMTIVPEPATSLLVGVGVLGLLASRARRLMRR